MSWANHCGLIRVPQCHRLRCRVAYLQCPFLPLPPSGWPGGRTASQSSAPVPHSDFAAQFAERYCSSIWNCCAAAGYVASSCPSSVQGQVEAALTATAANPRKAYDPAAAGRLIEQTVAANAACTDRALLISANLIWNDVFRGTGELGDTCRDKNPRAYSENLGTVAARLYPPGQRVLPRLDGFLPHRQRHYGADCTGCAHTTQTPSYCDTPLA